MIPSQRRYIAIVGPSEATDDQIAAALTAGRLFATAGAIVLTGGLGGVMGGAARGVREAGGVCVGLLPGSDRSVAHPELTVALPTGLGELRNGLLVRCADAVLAISGGWGTVSEVAFALRTRVPVVGLREWPFPFEGPTYADSVEQAVDLTLQAAHR
jgi:uncharacterized protein (TIGR00725 family)